MVMSIHFFNVAARVALVRRLRPKYRNGKLIPSLQPLSAERRWRIRAGTLVENWEFDRTEAASTGSVGVRQAAITKEVGQPVWNIKCVIRAQITHEEAMTGPSNMRRDGYVLDM
jgi:hypothetical protein